MLPSILVPLDGSALADQVLAHVAHLAGRERAHVHLLRVLGAEEAEAPARSHLDLARARLSASGASVEAHLARGEPVEEVLRFAAGRGLGLIALASHGRGGASRLVRGSVAEAITRRSATPVLVVTPRVGAPAFLRRVLVALDGTDLPPAAVPVIATLARGSPETEVLLVHVDRPGPARSAEECAAPLRPSLDALRAAGVRARAVVAFGEAVDEVLAAAEREAADLVAVTSTGRSGWARVIEGSFAEALLRRCTRPVLVVHAAPP